MAKPIGQTTAEGWECQTCSRCGGSGKHSYCTQHGSKCFGCGGKGTLLTERGQTAMEMLTKSCSVRADALKPGDVIRMQTLAGWGWFTVVETKWGQNAIVATNGNSNPKVYMIICKTYDFHLGAEDLIRVRHTDEEKKLKFEAALAFQSTL